MWEVSLHPEVEAWFLGLRETDTVTADPVAEAIDMLADQGPALGRPLVDRLKASRFHTMKELRPASTGASEVRIVFAFDPGREAILLVAGDKVRPVAILVPDCDTACRCPVRGTPGPAQRGTGRQVMNTASSWRDIKAKAREADPQWDTTERIQRRTRMREEMLAAISGAQLAEIRKSLGLTQAQLAHAAELSQARISQIENGTATSLESLRAYVTGLGGHLDIVARIGNVHLHVA